jgi:hypothetical protein
MKSSDWRGQNVCIEQYYGKDKPIKEVRDEKTLHDLTLGFNSLLFGRLLGQDSDGRA